MKNLAGRNTVFVFSSNILGCDLHDIYSVYKREYKAEINSLGYDLAVLRLVIQSLGRVQAPWIDLRGNIT